MNVTITFNEEEFQTALQNGLQKVLLGMEREVQETIASVPQPVAPVPAQTQPIHATIQQGRTEAVPVTPTAVPVQVAPAESAPQPAAAVPTAVPSYTQEQLALAASQVMEAKKDQTVIVNLLGKFGVQALTQLPKEQYGAFATELRNLGAKL